MFLQLALEARRLLRASRERPRGRRAAKQRYKIAPSHPPHILALASCGDLCSSRFLRQVPAQTHPHWHSVFWDQEHLPRRLRMEIRIRLKMGCPNKIGEHDRRLDHCEGRCNANPRPCAKGHELKPVGLSCVPGCETSRIKPIWIIPIISMTMNGIDGNECDRARGDRDAIELEGPGQYRERSPVRSDRAAAIRSKTCCVMMRRSTSRVRDRSGSGYVLDFLEHSRFPFRGSRNQIKRPRQGKGQGLVARHQKRDNIVNQLFIAHTPAGFDIGRPQQPDEEIIFVRPGRAACLHQSGNGVSHPGFVGAHQFSTRPRQPVGQSEERIHDPPVHAVVVVSVPFLDVVEHLFIATGQYRFRN